MYRVYNRLLVDLTLIGGSIEELLYATVQSTEYAVQLNMYGVKFVGSTRRSVTSSVQGYNDEASLFRTRSTKYEYGQLAERLVVCKRLNSPP